jgi:hypothetical protein
MATQPTQTEAVDDPGSLRRERRAHVRAPVRVAVSLLCIGKKTYGWCANISAGGIYVEADSQFPVGARVEVDALLAVDSAVHHLKVEGKVVHTYGVGMGIQYVEPNPESVLFIRRLVNRYLFTDRTSG